MRVFVTGANKQAVLLACNAFRQDKHHVETRFESASVAVVMFDVEHGRMMRPWLEAGALLGRAGARRVIVVTGPNVVWNASPLDEMPEVFVVGTLSAARSVLLLWASKDEAASCSACQE